MSRPSNAPFTSLVIGVFCRFLGKRQKQQRKEMKKNKDRRLLRSLNTPDSISERLIPFRDKKTMNTDNKVNHLKTGQVFKTNKCSFHKFSERNILQLSWKMTKRTITEGERWIMKKAGWDPWMSQAQFLKCCFHREIFSSTVNNGHDK